MRLRPYVRNVNGEIHAKDEEFTNAFSDSGTQIIISFLLGMFGGVMLSMLAAHAARVSAF
jgi:hypothetical protein